ncbi:MAG: hypothetical protein HOV94_19150 [Saccharothrix sp.]|nr:hypothetical protein [Saccharothrix sp.]
MSGAKIGYLMRPGRVTDRVEVAGMIRARAAWMREAGHRRWAGWDRNADELAAQLGDPRWPTWVLCDPAEGIVGLTTAADDTPLLGWSERERAEGAVFLQSTVTDPHCSGRGLGVLIAYWALDHAARQGRRWVRRGVLTAGDDNRGLLRYYRWQGWRVVRASRHPRRPEVTVWSLQRPAEHQPELDRLVRRQ